MKRPVIGSLWVLATAAIGIATARHFHTIPLARMPNLDTIALLCTAFVALLGFIFITGWGFKNRQYRTDVQCVGCYSYRLYPVGNELHCDECGNHQSPTPHIADRKSPKVLPVLSAEDALNM